MAKEEFMNSIIDELCACSDPHTSEWIFDGYMDSFIDDEYATSCYIEFARFYLEKFLPENPEGENEREWKERIWFAFNTPDHVVPDGDNWITQKDAVWEEFSKTTGMEIPKVKE